MARTDTAEYRHLFHAATVKINLQHAASVQESDNCQSIVVQKHRILCYHKLVNKDLYN